MSWLDTPNVPVAGSRDISPSSMAPKGYQQFRSVTALTKLSPPSGGAIALIQTESVDFRWTDDGSTPNPTVGMVLSAGSTLAYTGDLNKFQIIPVSGTGVLNISYYG
jgi:hypothetical protein